MYGDKIIFSEMKIYEDKPPIDFLMHYGTPRHSGRYPWGSGEDPYQHGSKDFLSRVEDMKKQGLKENAEDIKKYFGKNMTLEQYRQEKSWATYQRKMDMLNKIYSLKDDGLSNTEIGKKLGVNESTIRGMLDEEFQYNLQEAEKTAEFLYDKLQEKGMIDVGPGVERELGVSRNKFDQALWILQNKADCPVYSGGIKQPTNPGQQTNQTVLCLPGTQHKEIYNLENVHSLNEYYSHDGGETFNKFQYPTSLDSKRLMVRYAEDGGIDRDGVIELRRGVEDISLGNDRYSQVRILVDGTHYLKGMAVYSDDMPDGVDVIFNTNKKKGTPALGEDKNNTVLKKIKNDPDNPFGSLIKPNGQRMYDDPVTGEKKLSVINKRASEGDWTDWQDALPSQFLSKQARPLAKKQLDLAKADKYAEYEDICAINNPTIKKYYLQKFADECDSAAVNLKAAALPGQKYHVIIPINTLKDTEVYAPQYENGTKLALIRYPHGGTFEIPILTVNNKNKLGDKWIGKTAIDGVGITKNVADRLSGADFDGDTVMCIPTHDKAGRVKITSTKPLKDLEGFDPKAEYPYRKGMKEMKDTQKQMGVISNLITDMTLGGATPEELARAVKHSMVVIDAEKHRLDYKRSEKENKIQELKDKYQVTVKEDGTIKTGGASTLLSRSKGEYSVLKRQGSPRINIKGTKDYDPTRPEGAKIYKISKDAVYEKTKVNKRTGEVTTTTEYRTQKSTRMAETDDAYTLVSTARHPMELIYADYANSMKALANQARKEYATTGNLKYSKEANAKYSKEVDSLNAKLNNALLNSPREREAMRRANVAVDKKKALEPDMKKSDEKKLKQQELTKARHEVGSIARRDRNIQITDSEWEAIQAGAIHENTLKKILNNSDPDMLREKATPKTAKTVTAAKSNRIKAMASSNYTIKEIAEKLDVSPSLVSQVLKGEK